MTAATASRRAGGAREGGGDRAEDPVRAYAEAVVAGEIVAGRLVRLAGERHLRDLETGHERGLRFNLAEAEKAIALFRYLPQRAGPRGGEPIELQPWQQFRIGSVFGWQRFDAEFDRWARRFNVAWNEVARKNGKTTESAVITIKLAAYDGEEGAQVYTVATQRSQARQCYDEAHLMVGHPKTPRSLKARFVRHPDNDNLGPTSTCRLTVPASASFIEPLGMDTSGNSLHGFNPHGQVFDEMHAWSSREQWNVLTTAGGARLQPLIWIITTAGNNKTSIGYEQHSYAVNVVEGKVQDDSWFVYIATIDEPEKWADPAEWAKANPNLGVSLRTAYLEAQCAKATVLPSEKVKFLQLHANMWVEKREDPWMSVDVWDRQPLAMPLPGAECHGGLDLASTRDICAFALWFPDGVEEVQRKAEDGSQAEFVSRIPHGGTAKWLFWIPGDALEERERAVGGAPVRSWVDEGWLRVTPGATINYDIVERDILEVCAEYNVKSIGADPWNATGVVQHLNDEGHTTVTVQQTVTQLNEPTKMLEKLLMDGEFRHDGNPVARWMFSNVVLYRDSYQNVRPDRKKSAEKIDGIAALVMAIKEGMAPDESLPPSVYEEE